MSDKLTRLSISFAPEDEDRIIGLLFLCTPWGWQDEGMVVGLRRLVVHFDQPEQTTALEAALVAAVPDMRLDVASVDNADWNSAWKKYFTPIPIGSRFLVLPAWLAGEEQERLPILIEPKMAFGTGHHQTTALCLEALDNLSNSGLLCPGQRFLDLGTGSGILGIAAVKLGLIGQGLDIDPVAIDNARENAALNAVEGELTLAVGGIDALPKDVRFDCIMANILAHPLMDMAEQICRHLAPHGKLILSGILCEQAQAVAKTYLAQGLGAPTITCRGDWALLVFGA